MSGGGRALLHTLRIWGAGSSRQISRHGVGVPVTSSPVSMRFESIRPFSNAIPTPAFFGPGLHKSSSHLLGVTTGTGDGGSFQFQPTRCYIDKTPKDLMKSSAIPESVCESCGGAVNRGKGHLGSSKEAVNSEMTKFKDEKEKCVQGPLHETEEFKIIDMRELLHGAGEKISSGDDDLPPSVGDKFKNAFHKGTELLVGAVCFVLVSAGYLVLVCSVALVCMLPFLLFSWLLDECGFGFVFFVFVYALLMLG